MRLLTDYQREFLLDYFFETERFPDWKEVAKKLLETGVGVDPNLIKITT